MDVIQFIMGALQGTPWWVWIIFGYLLVIGIIATRPRTIELPKLFIVPTVFLFMKYKLFLSGNLYVILAYIASFVISTLITEKITNYEKIEIISGKLSVRLPGTYSTLVLVLLLFSLKYAFGYVYATSKVVSLEFMLFETTVGGIISGIFLGKAVNYTKRYYKAS